MRDVGQDRGDVGQEELRVLELLGHGKVGQAEPGEEVRAVHALGQDGISWAILASSSVEMLMVAGRTWS